MSENNEYTNENNDTNSGVNRGVNNSRHDRYDISSGHTTWGNASSGNDSWGSSSSENNVWGNNTESNSYGSSSWSNSSESDSSGSSSWSNSSESDSSGNSSWGNHSESDSSESSNTESDFYKNGSWGNSGSGTSENGGSSYSDDDWNLGKKEQKPKKTKGSMAKNSLLKKAVAIAMSAVLFGGVAGGTAVGVLHVAQKNGVISQVTEESKNAQIKVAETSNSSNSSSSDSGVLADVSSIVEKVLPSVVAITNSQIYESYANQFNGWSYFFGGGYNSGNSGESTQEEIEAGSGSGIIIGQNDTELLIVTNYHVIEDADSLTITFIDESTAKASVKGTDSGNDLAVVAVSLEDLTAETQEAIAIATMDTSENYKVGQGVIAIGNALGYGQSITVGYISALDRAVQTSDGSSRNLLQTDAAINPGNSGGALVNMDGEIIGINSAKYSDTDVEGMGFAIPISAVYDIIDNLMNQKTKVEVAEDQRGYLGIQGLAVDSSYAQAYGTPQGVYIYSVIEGCAADNADLRAKDIITKINGEAVTTVEQLSEQLKYYAIGEKVTLTVSRLEGGEYVSSEVEVTLTAQGTVQENK